LRTAAIKKSRETTIKGKEPTDIKAEWRMKREYRGAIHTRITAKIPSSKARKVKIPSSLEATLDLSDTIPSLREEDSFDLS